MPRSISSLLRVATVIAVTATMVQAQSRLVTVTLTNLAPVNSVSFAPLHLGFHNGTFDPFNIGTTAGPAIVSVAEGGAGGRWQADFAATDPTSTRGTIGGALTPGQSRSQSFIVNTGTNRFFSFASMVIPSNDFFIGNDNSRQFNLFDDAGNLLLSSINLTAGQIWDAGSEAFSIAGAAFLTNGNNDLRTPQNGVVGFNFQELLNFDGEMTAAGFVFNSGLTADRAIYRIDFTSTSVVPEPSAVILLASGLAMLGLAVRRKRGVQA